MESAANQALGTVSCPNISSSVVILNLFSIVSRSRQISTDTFNVLAVHQVGANRRYTRRRETSFRMGISPP